jgi:hypothetical protein
VLFAVTTTAPFFDTVNASTKVLALCPMNVAIPPGTLLNVAVQLFPLLSVAINVLDVTFIG